MTGWAAGGAATGELFAPEGAGTADTGRFPPTGAARSGRFSGADEGEPADGVSLVSDGTAAGGASCCRDGSEGDMGKYPGVFGPDRKKSFTPTIRSPTATRPMTGSMISPKGIMERFSLSLLLSLVDIQIPPLPVKRQEQNQPHLLCSRKTTYPKQKAGILVKIPAFSIFDRTENPARGIY